jgi:hypothetical protein
MFALTACSACSLSSIRESASAVHRVRVRSSSGTNYSFLGGANTAYRDLAVAAFQYYLESEHEALQEIIGQAQDDYRSALDKLEDMSGGK